MKLAFGIWTMLVALTVSVVAAYYSIVGLTAIFAAAVYLTLEWYFGYANRWVALAAMGAAFLMRILSVWRQVTLPHFTQRQRH